MTILANKGHPLTREQMEILEKYLIGERDTEPFILDYGDDIETPDQWKGEVGITRLRRKNESSK